MILPCLLEVSKIFYAIKNLFNYYSLSSNEEQIIKTQFSTNQLTSSLHNRLNGQNVGLLNQTLQSFYQTSYPKYEQEMSKSIPIGVVKYFGILMKRIFFAGRKLLKNDLIDSQLLFIYDSEQLLSIDDKFVKIIEDFDAQYASKMDAFNSSVLK